MAHIASQIIEVCVFRRGRESPEYLLLHRSPDEKIYPNVWQFVTGSIEEGEKASDAAFRELSEETGLIATRFWTAPHIISFYDPTWDTVNLNPFFAAEIPAGSEPRLSPEHDQCGWYAFEPALERLVWPGQREGLRIIHQFIAGGQEAAWLTRIL